MSTAGGVTMDRVAELLQRDARLAADAVTRPHELLVTAWRTLAAPNGRAQEKLCVVFAPAALCSTASPRLFSFANFPLFMCEVSAFRIAFCSSAICSAGNASDLVN